MGLRVRLDLYLKHFRNIKHDSYHLVSFGRVGDLLDLMIETVTVCVLMGTS